MNRYRAGGESSRHEYAAHTQNNTICELVAVVVVGAGESVEKPANPCQCWIFLTLSDLVSCRRAGGFSVESCKRSPQGVSRRCHGVGFLRFFALFLWKLWRVQGATSLWKTLRKSEKLKRNFWKILIFHSLSEKFCTIRIFHTP